ncbi:TIGR03943 family putative permease subunit [Microlunatus sp. GCM10028923]|uniref:TIGR03943 family putative permease subunit n=1 Tax=Microlunatus sp. GCM10028923 TaxID=3273400 RepID=UPI00360B1C45
MKKLAAAKRKSHPGWARLAEAFLILSLGGTLIGIVGTGHYQRYLRSEMAIPLLLTGGCLAALALWTMIVVCLRPRNAEAHDHEEHADAEHDHDGHDHEGHGHGGAWSVWLLLVPVVIVAVISPPAIGAQLAQRRGPAPVSAADAPPLPDVPTSAGGSGQVMGLPMAKYAALAVTRPPEELAGRRFTITGFVINHPQGDGWYLARIRIQCCAADGVPVLVRITGAAPQNDDRWLEVTGTFQPPVVESSGYVARLAAEDVREIPEPADPYVY